MGSLLGGLLLLPLPADVGCDSGRFRYSSWYRRRLCLHIAALHERSLRRVTGVRCRNPSRYLVRKESNVVFSAQVRGGGGCIRFWRDLHQPAARAPAWWASWLKRPRALRPIDQSDTCALQAHCSFTPRHCMFTACSLQVHCVRTAQRSQCHRDCTAAPSLPYNYNDTYFKRRLCDGDKQRGWRAARIGNRQQGALRDCAPARRV
ncbi:hypothetical protein D3C81_1191200 [compost metagenome]